MKPLEDMGRYATVVVDPPWPLKGFGFVTKANKSDTHGWGGYDLKTGGVDYATMKLSDIASIPIHLVIKDESFLFLWTVNRYLRYGFDLLEMWGMTYSFTMTWVKNRGIQTPITPCFNAEWILVGRRGNPQWLDTRSFRTANYWEWSGASRKPEGFYDLLRRVTPAPRLDIFGRRAIGGFDSWGIEAPTVNHEPDMFQGVLLD